MAVRCRVSDADVVIVIVTNLFSLDVARALRERRAREGLHGALDLWAEAGHEPGLAPRKRVLIRALRSLRTHGGRCRSDLPGDSESGTFVPFGDDAPNVW